MVILQVHRDLKYQFQGPHKDKSILPDRWVGKEWKLSGNGRRVVRSDVKRVWG